MNKKLAAAAVSILLLGGQLAPLWAEDGLGGPDIDAGKFSIGGRGMYFDSQGSNDDKWHGGGQVRIHLSKVLAVEGSADYRQDEFGLNEVNTFPVQASLLAYLMPGKRISPFILAGPGWYFTNIEDAAGNDDTQHRFGFHAGGGLQFFLNKHWSVDSTYRYVWLSDVEAVDASLNPKEYDDKGHMITAALNLHF